MTYINTAWVVQCLLYYRPSIDEARESAAVTTHNATLSDFVNALCNRETNACKQCAAHARRLRVRQACNLHTAVRLHADFTSDVRLFSQQPHASVLGKAAGSVQPRRS